MKVLICGGRDYTNQAQFEQVIRSFIAAHGRITCIVCGGQRGADLMAVRYANWHRIKTSVWPANWEKYGRGAGPIRNQLMLDANPDIAFVIAFPGGKGTADMIYRARAVGLEVLKLIEVKND